MKVIYACPDGTPFPVRWPDARDAGDEWRWDPVHNPTPLTPLAQDLITLKRRGMYRGGEQTGRPFREQRMYANGYGFARRAPLDQREVELARTVAERDRGSRMDRLIELWERSYRPESIALTRSIETWAPAEDTLPGLLARLDEVEAAWERLGELHTLSTGLAGIAMREFVEFCVEAFGNAGHRFAVESAGGMSNMSVESGKALWELSRRALELPEVAALLRTAAPCGFMSRLASVRDGPRFAGLLDVFLDAWGRRNESYYEIAFPTWREDPGIVLSIVRAYLDTPEDQAPALSHETAVGRRRARTAEARERLPVPGRFDAFLDGQRRASQHTVLMEDHNFYIDQWAYMSLRTPFLAVGERLAREGVVDVAADVLFLHLDEIKRSAELGGDGYQSLVARRRADRERWVDVQPPAVIGADAPVADGTRRERRNGDASGLIHGLPASAGTATGAARVIRSLDEAHRLSQGDILVTYATTPSWTPLFAIAGGVVTDAGGPLAHCAIVAREYGIPAVVGAGDATGRIQDGTLITVDGTVGAVTLNP